MLTVVIKLTNFNLYLKLFSITAYVCCFLHVQFFKSIQNDLFQHHEYTWQYRLEGVTVCVIRCCLLCHLEIISICVWVSECVCVCVCVCVCLCGCVTRVCVCVWCVSTGWWGWWQLAAACIFMLTLPRSCVDMSSVTQMSRQRLCTSGRQQQQRRDGIKSSTAATVGPLNRFSRPRGWTIKNQSPAERLSLRFFFCVHFFLFQVQRCTVYSVQCTVYSVQCTVYSVHALTFTLYVLWHHAGRGADFNAFNPLVPGMQNVKIRQFIIGCLLRASIVKRPVVCLDAHYNERQRINGLKQKGSNMSDDVYLMRFLIGSPLDTRSLLI